MRGDVLHRLVQPDIALGVPGDLAAGVLDDDDGLDAAGFRHRDVDIGLQRHLAAAAQALVGGDDDLRTAPSMRPASASGEKPPNTIEWTAPIRAQASIA